MSEFTKLKRDRDILVRVIIKKKEGRFCISVRCAIQRQIFRCLLWRLAQMDGKLCLSIEQDRCVQYVLEIDVQKLMQGEDAKVTRLRRYFADFDGGCEADRRICGCERNGRQ